MSTESRDILPTLSDPNQILLGGMTGIMWHPFAPRAEDVRYEHFSMLHRIPRWGGGTIVPYDVAEHSVRCALLVRSWGAPESVQLEALDHDIHEVYPPYDVPGPMMRGDNPRALMLREWEREVRTVVRVAIGMPLRMDPRVHQADMILLATERRDLLPLGFDEHFAGLPEPLLERIVPWGQAESGARFLDMYLKLGGARP